MKKVLLVVAALALAVACGGGGGASGGGTATKGPNPPVAQGDGSRGATVPGSISNGGTTTLPGETTVPALQGPPVIRQAQLSITVGSGKFSSKLSDLRTLVEGHGGYIAGTDAQARPVGTDQSGPIRTGVINFMVPAANFDATIDDLAKIGRTRSARSPARSSSSRARSSTWTTTPLTAQSRSPSRKPARPHRPLRTTAGASPPRSTTPRTTSSPRSTTSSRRSAPLVHSSSSPGSGSYCGAAGVRRRLSRITRNQIDGGRDHILASSIRGPDEVAVVGCGFRGVVQ